MGARSANVPAQPRDTIQGNRSPVPRHKLQRIAMNAAVKAKSIPMERGTGSNLAKLTPKTVAATQTDKSNAPPPTRYQ